MLGLHLALGLDLANMLLGLNSSLPFCLTKLLLQLETLDVSDEVFLLKPFLIAEIFGLSLFPEFSESLFGLLQVEATNDA